jgi:imidazolonepropionase-like amidohydrolase
MKRQLATGVALLALGLGGPCLGAEGQKAVVIHAGQLFDGKSDRLLSNQVIVIQGDRIADVGPAGSMKIPTGAEEIDLGSGAIMPGLIDSHNHMFKIGDHPGAEPDASVPAEIKPGSVFSPGYVTLLAAKNAKLDLESGFTTIRDLSSGGTLDVDLRKAINEGLIPGPRMQSTTEGMRGSVAGPRYSHLVDSPWEGRKQVRIQLKNGAELDLRWGSDETNRIRALAQALVGFQRGLAFSWFGDVRAER